MDLLTRRLRTATALAGPLLFVEGARRARLGEMVRIRLAGDPERRGQVIAVDETRAVVQVLEETRGLAPARAEVELTGRVASLGVSRRMLGRTFDGSGAPADGLPAPLAEAILPVHGLALNVTRRQKPSEFIETGVSAIDGMNTLVRGQKLPIFSCAGLPASRLAAQIVRQARVRGGEPFCVVFAAIGTPFREADEYLRSFAESGTLDRTVVFMNRADDPPIERLLTPRCALTAAEHLAFAGGMHVLVVLTDMVNYCEALREVALARQEIPGRRGYPGTMYTDLATIYERAGKIAGRPGSVTQLPVVTMPDDDLTHPIPDLSGYITEGQVVLSRDLDRKGVFPPVDVLPSLSRLMNAGIGPERTREDHRPLADQLYACYARGCDVRRMAAIVGAQNLGEDERRYLDFAERFELQLVNQGGTFRSLEETLGLGWRLLAGFPRAALTRVKAALVERYLPEGGEAHGAGPDDAHGAPRREGAAADGAQGGAAPPRQA
jgi:V/A-type H+-transporting ATPase subunit B